MFNLKRSIQVLCVSLIPLLSGVTTTVAQEPIIPGLPTNGPTTATLTPDQRANLLEELTKAKKHDKEARAGHSQNPLRQAAYDEKIDQINRLTKGLQEGKNYLMSDVQKALKPPRR